MQSRVDAGVAFLNEKKPGWFEQIDLDRLDISSCTECVLGQLMGSAYVTGLDLFGLKISETTGLGFARHYSDEASAFTELTGMWKTTIEKLRAEAGTLAAAR